MPAKLERDPNVKMKKLIIEIPEELHKDVKIHCIRHDITMKKFVKQQLRKGVSN